MKRKPAMDLFSIDEGSRERVEEFDGVFELRRKIVFGVPASLLLMPKLAFGSSRKRIESGGLAWEQFLAECLPKATELSKDPSASGQDAYLFWLASMLSRLDAETMPKGKLQSFADLQPVVETGPSYFGKPFFVIEWRMAPNAYLPPHNHPNISVCTVCTDGDAILKNYQPEGETPEFASQSAFKVRQTNEQLLTAGRINALSAVRDNIHTFKAGKRGARGFDVTTYHGKDAGFSFLDIAGRPSATDDRLFEATWRKK